MDIHEQLEIALKTIRTLCFICQMGSVFQESPGSVCADIIFAALQAAGGSHRRSCQVSELVIEDIF